MGETRVIINSCRSICPTLYEMKQLIVNADDFGLTPGVNEGIIQGFSGGILTSATIMANGAAFEGAVERARRNPGLGVGCHLVIVGGRAIAPREQVRSLADARGELPGTLLALMAKISLSKAAAGQIANEFRAQIERVRAAGIEPTHLDTHKHAHAHPVVMEALGKVAREFGIRKVRRPFEGVRRTLASCAPGKGRASFKQAARALAAHTGILGFSRVVARYGLRTPDHFFGVMATGALGAESIIGILEDLPDGVSELMCHPGICDAALQNSGTRLRRERELELGALKDPAVRDAVAKLGIKLVSYRALD
jgi:chitin disaccharide deacetylase